MMNRLVAASLTILLLGCGSYVLAASGGGSSGDGNAASVQYTAKTPETPTTTPGAPTYETTTAPQQKVKGQNREGGEGQVGGRQRGANEPNAGGDAGPETRLTSNPVDGETESVVEVAGLPFTGQELIALALIGLLLLGLGLAERRLRRSQ